MRAASATSAASNTIFFIYSSLFFAVLSRTRSLPTQRRRPAPRPETVNRLGVLPPACPSRCSGGSSPPCERTVFVPRRAEVGFGGSQEIQESGPSRRRRIRTEAKTPSRSRPTPPPKATCPVPGKEKKGLSPNGGGNGGSSGSSGSGTVPSEEPCAALPEGSQRAAQLSRVPMAPATVSETVLWVCVRASCTAPRLAAARLGRACGTSGSTTQRTVEWAASEPRIREGAGSDVFSRAEGACFPADPTGGLGEEVGTPLAVGGMPLASGSWSRTEEDCEPAGASVRGAEEAGFGSVAEPGVGRAPSGRILGLGWSVGEVAEP